MTVVVDCANGAAYNVAPGGAARSWAPRSSRSAWSRTARTSTTAAARCTPRGWREAVARARRATSASRSTATPTASSWSTRTGRVVDGDAIMAHRRRATCSAAARCAKQHGGRHGDEQPRPGARAGRRGAARWCAPRSATATSSRRCARSGYNLGGEQSGHLIFLDHVTTGDGVAAALNVLAVMRREGRAALRAGRAASSPCPQVLVNVAVREKRPLAELPGGAAGPSRRWRRRSAADGRVLVRFSGTENKVRVLVEGPDAKRIRATRSASRRAPEGLA